MTLTRASRKARLILRAAGMCPALWWLFSLLLSFAPARRRP
ncbi:hypothetical protein [Candidatus Competibacter denitrificans]|nr:hypothetical protein [Candidatus Competibacter denitrificans]